MSQQQTEQKQPLPGTPFPSPPTSTVTGTLSCDGIDLTNCKPQFIPPSVSSFCLEEFWPTYYQINSSTKEVFTMQAVPSAILNPDTGRTQYGGIKPRPVFAINHFSNYEFDIVWRFRLVAPPIITGRALIRWSSGGKFPEGALGVKKEWDFAATDFFEFTIPRVNPYTVKFHQIDRSLIPTLTTSFSAPSFVTVTDLKQFLLGNIRFEMLSPLRVSSLYPQTIYLIQTHMIVNPRVFHPRDYVITKDPGYGTILESFLTTKRDVSF